MSSPYLLNTWYAAGYSEEFREKPVPRTLLGRELVFYRGESGKLAALEDRCPHRFAPLHMGKILGEHLRCQYHGSEFDHSGRCVRNPSDDRPVPAAMKTLSFPLIERDGVIWVWLGDTPPAAELPAVFSRLVPSGYAVAQGYVRVQGHYQLVTDNLLDLSHAEFLHSDLGAEGFNRRTKYTVEQDGDVVIANHLRHDVPISRMFKQAWGDGAPEQVDHRALARWYPPSSVHLEIGVNAVGDSGAGPTTLAMHLITPETEHVSHYFWRVAYNFHQDDPVFADRFRGVVQAAFENEDEPMIAAQHRKLGGAAFEALRPVLLSTDAATVRARRILQRLLAEQQAAAG